MPYSPAQKSCVQLKDHKGKTTGLMMEGSAMHMSMLHQEETKKVEEAKAKKLDKKQEIKEHKKDLLTEMPIDNRGVGEMSPYKMDHGSPAKQTDERDGSGNSNVDESGHYGGARLHYADKKYDKSIRQMFNESFKTAKAAGAKTFDFHHSGVKDPETGTYKFKGGTYTTETKK